VCSSDLFVKNAESEQLKAEMEKIFAEAFPNEPLIDPLQQMTAQAGVLRRQGGGRGTGSVVDMIKAISEVVGTEMTFHINELHRDSTGFRLRAETDSYENISTIQNKISALESIGEVRVSDSTTRKGVIAFELAISEGGR